MCNKAVNTDASAIQFISDRDKTQEMCVKTVDSYCFLFGSVTDWYKTQKMCYKVISNDPFMLKYCLDWYKTHKICHKAVNHFLSALKFAPDWFVTSKMIKDILNALFSNDYIIFVNEDSNYVTFLGGETGFFSVGLDKINLGNVNFDEDDPETNRQVRHACDMASNKMVGLLHLRRWELRNKTICAWWKVV